MKKEALLKKRIEEAETVREEVFGIEDGIVSTLGALTGIAAGSQSQFIVVLSGLVIVAVEAVSMAAGSYLSSKSAMEILANKKTNDRNVTRVSERSGLLMGAAYILGGAIPLFPYLVLSISEALPLAIGLSVSALFVVGALTARATHRVWWRSGLEMVLVSLGAAVIGYLVGDFVRGRFGV